MSISIRWRVEQVSDEKAYARTESVPVRNVGGGGLGVCECVDDAPECKQARVDLSSFSGLRALDAAPAYVFRAGKVDEVDLSVAYNVFFATFTAVLYDDVDSEQRVRSPVLVATTCQPFLE